jgi:hypothetical protein
MAEVVEPPFAESLPGLANLQQIAEMPSFSRTSYGYTDHGETIVRRTGCVNCARPDLWGAWVSDLPNLPNWLKKVYKLCKSTTMMSVEYPVCIYRLK